MAHFISKHARVFTLAIVCSLFVPLSVLHTLRLDNSIEVWLLPDSLAYQHYQQFLERYGSDEFVLIGMEQENPLSESSLVFQNRLHKELSRVVGVETVVSLPGMLSVLPPGGIRDQQQLHGLNQFIIGADEHTVGMFVLLSPPSQGFKRREIVAAIEQTVTAFESPGFTMHLVGTPLLNAELDRVSQRSAALFTSLALVVTFATLVLLFRNAGCVLAPLLAVYVTVIWTLGLMSLFDYSLNMVTVMLPTLLFVLSLSSGIHITSRYVCHSREHPAPVHAAFLTLQELWTPTAFTGLSTAAGFASLMFSEMRPVSELGLFTAVGMILSFGSNLCIIPGVLSFFSYSKNPPKQQAALSSLIAVVPLLLNRSRLVIALSILLLGGSLAACFSLKTESNILQFFPPHSKIVLDYEWMSNRLTGMYSIEFNITTPPSDEQRLLSALQKLETELTTHPAVATVLHFGKLLPLISLAEQTGLPSSDPARPGLPDEYLRRFRYPDSDRQTVGHRLSILVKTMNSEDFYPLLQSIRTAAQTLLPSTSSWIVTGTVPLLNDVQQSLVSTQIKSLSLAALVVLTAIGVMFRSIRVFAAALLPNLLPILTTLAFMSLLGIPLDTATVMIAGVAIGIAVDDTVHFLFRFREERLSGLSCALAVSAALSRILKPIVVTTCVIVLGFCTFGFAEFRPIAYFGILTGLTMVTALIADLFILPVMVCFLDCWRQK